MGRMSDEEFHKHLEELKAENAARHAAMTPEELRTEAAEAERYRRANCKCDPDCPICGGKGDMGYTDEENYYHPQECPNYYLMKLVKNAKAYGLYPVELEKLDWSIVKDINNAHKAMSSIQRVLNNGYGWIFLWGDHGQAKTLMLKIAIAMSLKNHVEAAYTTMVGILDNLKKAFDTNKYDRNKDAESKLAFWEQIPILAIDEFNRIKESDWVDERRFALMDTRYTQAIQHETITLIASNTPPEQQDSYLRDRILDGRFEVIELKGPSVRKSIHNKDFMF